ncbi:uncharacterized protein BO72DRAFT_445233 [Aspergillus fijiensis CBS 313.89]|uniref:Uncharacterized protein n=2 Tax=Aspergillus TaxID=5052 RepID=A0A8G1RZS9_9EURO|nr:uncharacterized protein BO72DRAFT_445233 [Aspergillus fijiensis CBS 313.89]RAK80666.1 hypothetical protein BO72DRAFT_445233 [Aspergillus fijiensis CBS 313.89]
MRPRLVLLPPLLNDELVVLMHHHSRDLFHSIVPDPLFLTPPEVYYLLLRRPICLGRFTFFQKLSILFPCKPIPNQVLTLLSTSVDTASSPIHLPSTPIPTETMSNDQPQSPRHWHGDPGNRHEHLNVWVRGGPSSPYFRRPSVPGGSVYTTATGPEMTTDRRGSSSSDMSSNSTNMSSSPPRAPDRRRSSGQNSSLFEGLTSQKRNSADPNFASRRESYTEQAQTGGMFARWWDGYTRGSNQGK